MKQAKRLAALLLAAVFCVTLFPAAVSAEPGTGETLLWSFDFETDPKEAGWTFVDADGDGENWFWLVSDDPYAKKHSGTGVITSDSYINGYGPVSPDNWAVTPAVTLPAGTARVSLWAVGQDSSWAAEHFRIYAGESADVSAMTPVSEEIVATGDYLEYTADLSGFCGKTVYVAVRHYNITDMFRVNIDDIAIYSKGPDGVAIDVSAVPAECGTVTGGGSYAPGSTVTLTAVPEEGYIFENWTEDGKVVSTDNPLTFTAEVPRSLTAVFSLTSVSFTKVNAADGEPLEGASLQLSRDGVGVVDWWTSTNEAHTIVGLAVGAEYTLSETTAPDGYILANDAVLVLDEDGKIDTEKTTLSVTGDNSVEFVNSKTIIGVSKVDSETGEALAGAALQIVDPEGNIREQWTSGEEAHLIEGLLTGVEYTLKETAAPQGYTAAGDTTFSIDQTGKVTSTGSTTTDGEGRTVLLVEDTIVLYTVTFADDDGTVISTKQYPSGTKAAEIEVPADPVKAADAQYTYTFKEWTPGLADVTSDAAYTAVYDKTVNKYTITWKNDDGTVIDTTEEEYGATPTHADPVKASTAEYTYTFAGWTPEIVPVTGDAEYTAVFTDASEQYVVTWIIDGKKELETYSYGATPTHADPVKAADAQYTYTFKGWTPSVVPVTGDAEYTAVFDKTVNQYTVTWIIDGHRETEIYSYGEMPVHAKPVKNSMPPLVYYTFLGWSPKVTAVTRSAVYTAVFEENITPISPFIPKPPVPELPSAPADPVTPPVAASPTVPAPVFPFGDVTPASPFYDDIAYVWENEIMNGMSAASFGENLPLTRGMIVTILHRMEGRPAVEYSGVFKDVPDGEWYTDGVEWAASHGIVLGYGDSTFGPDDCVTREQLAAILFRYAGFKGYDVSVGEDTNILSYDDAFDISSWAVPSMQWACGASVLNSAGTAEIRPTDNATRGEIARAIHVFCETVAR